MKMINFLFATTAVIFFISCGNNYDDLANSQTLLELKMLMQEHPELARADLHNIKTASSNSRVHAHTKKEDNNAEHQEIIDPSVAKKAQDLIDKILEDFDLESQIKATVKAKGITINMQKERIKSYSNAKNYNMKGFDELGEDKKDRKILSCEDYIKDPFNGISVDMLTAILKKNHNKLKQSLSGCAKIHGQMFLSCIEDDNKMTSIINKNATCDMKNFSELSEIAKKSIGKSIEEVALNALECKQEHFAKCGYKFNIKE